MAMVEFSRKHHSGSDLRRVCATKHANDNVAGPQGPSRSCCSNRSRDASVASRRSSSDQESDHSTRRSPPRSASCCAQTSTFLASSGESIRTTLMSDSSLALKPSPPSLVPSLTPSALQDTATYSKKTPQRGQREGNGFVALCPELDIASEGSSIEQARTNLVEALTLWPSLKPLIAHSPPRRHRA